MTCLVGSWHLLTRIPPGEAWCQHPKFGGGGGAGGWGIGSFILPSFAYLLGFRGTNYIGRKSGMVSVIYEENYESARERSEGCLGGGGPHPRA